MTIDKHIYFSSEEYIHIKDYAHNNKIPFSKAVNRLCAIALHELDILNEIKFLEKNINYLIKKQKVMHSLIEQIYSDMDFENITDPKKSNALNKFNKKIRNSYIND